MIKPPFMGYSETMKIWIKYLIGAALGFFAAVVIPFDGHFAQEVLAFLTELAIRFGRYTILPVMFFGVSVAVFRLRSSHNLVRPTLLILAVMIVSACLLTIIGILSVLVFKLPRIPIPTGKMSDVASIDIKSLVFALFPFSGFQSFLDGVFLLPLFLFAALAGAGCASDINASKPAVTLFSSLSKVAYNVMCFFVDMFALGMIAIACKWFVESLPVFASGIYTPLIIMLLVDFVLVSCVIYPVLLYLFCPGSRPFRVLYASICPVLVAFFSGDTNLVLPVAIRHGHESLGMKRKINSVSYPVFSVFARGGSALVVSICFVLILSSYSSLSISFSDIMWIAGCSFALSFVLGSLPVGGAFVALTMMCAMYGRGFEAGYILIKPVALIIGSFAAAIDGATAMFGSYFVAHKMKMTENYELKKFI